jgi:DNA-binding NarL/FixJ family response regulator
MKRMFIVGTDAFLVTTMRVALRYSSETTVFGAREGDASVARALREARPDIVLLDGSVPVERTLERLAQVADERPSAIVLVLASRVDPAALEHLLLAGATVCLSHALTAGQLELLLADAPEAGEDVPAMPMTMPALMASAPTQEPSLPEPSQPLTNREMEILRCVAEGHTNARIGRDLWVTEQTVKFHLSNIYRKLGVTNRTEASRYVLLHGGQLGAPRQAAQAAPAVASVADLVNKGANGHDRPLQLNGHARRNGTPNPVIR